MQSIFPALLYGTFPKATQTPHLMHHRSPPPVSPSNNIKKMRLQSCDKSRQMRNTKNKGAYLMDKRPYLASIRMKVTNTNTTKEKKKGGRILVKVCVYPPIPGEACQLRCSPCYISKLGMIKSQDAIIRPCIHAVTVALSAVLFVSGFNLLCLN